MRQQLSIFFYRVVAIYYICNTETLLLTMILILLLNFSISLFIIIFLRHVRSLEIKEHIAKHFLLQIHCEIQLLLHLLLLIQIFSITFKFLQVFRKNLYLVNTINSLLFLPKSEINVLYYFQLTISVRLYKFLL